MIPDLNHSVNLIYYGPIVNGSNDVQVFRNPSKAEFEQLLRESQFGSLRGLLGSQLHLWEAFKATADQVRETMVSVGKPFDGVAIDLYTTEVWANFKNELYRFRKEEFDEWARWISQHQVLRRLYPGGFKLRLRKQGHATILAEMQV